MSTHVEVRRGAYHDSVTLMRASRELAELPEVVDALVAMGTPLNLELLDDLGLAPPDSTGADDLVVAIRCADGADIETALDRLEELLAARPSGPGGPAEAPVRTVGAALAREPAPLALVSVPGEAAFAEAMDAVHAGSSVLVFSDNVPVEQEIALKDEAASRDVLVLGPDCGTAMVGGVGLGFANVVAPGPVSLVAASGTGAQQLMCLLDAAGVGVRHCLGVGGRDLSAAVGGRSAGQALGALAADPGTELTVVVSKPPDGQVARRLHDEAAARGQRVLWALLGPDQPDLTAVAEQVLRALDREVPQWPRWMPERSATPAPGRALRGLFCGGTLRDEAAIVAGAALDPDRYELVDFGDDVYTRGRAHPMIDPTLRDARLAGDGQDAGVGAVLLDVVLGHGSHEDPAGDLAPVIEQVLATPDAPAVVISLVGAAGDPQGLDTQARTLAGAGAEVYLSNAEAARRAVTLVGGHPPPASEKPVAIAAGYSDATTATTQLRGLLTAEPEVVTAGVDLLADALERQAVPVRRVDWRPPLAGSSPDALARVVGDRRREEANAEAVGRVLTAGAELVDVLPARDALGLVPGQFCHAGPPIEWARTSGPLRGALVGAAMFEGLAGTAEEAEELFAAGGGELAPCHSRGAVGPMAGVISPSMWGFVLREPTYGGTAYCTLNEGLGKVLRYGAYGPEVIDRLGWMSGVLGPLLQVAVRRRRDRGAPLDVRAIVAQMLHMGDEGHNRNRAGTMLAVRELLPELIGAADEGTLPGGLGLGDVADVVRFANGNDHFFLNLVMPASKLAFDTARGVAGSSMVVAMARNGTDFGIQVAGAGDAWFTGPAGVPDGLYLGTYGPGDANPDIGDSTITETTGLGGFAMAAAPAIVSFVGGTVDDALAATRAMYDITLAEHPAYQVPVLGFRGVPVGIDVTAVVRTGVLPNINTGIAGRVAGTGQVGAGLVRPPADCFTAALDALAGATAPAP